MIIPLTALICIAIIAAAVIIHDQRADDVADQLAEGDMVNLPAGLRRDGEG